MAKIIVDGDSNLAATDPSTIENGTITANTDTEFQVTATDGTVYTLLGNFSGGSGSTPPSSGTISRIVIDGPGTETTERTTISGLALDVTTFEDSVASDSVEHLVKRIFAHDDVFNLSQGGTDVMLGGGGNDRFLMGSTLDSSDSLDGNGGFNTVVLDGDYSAGLTLGTNSLIQIDKLALTGAFSYDITTNDANVAAHHTLVVDARPGNSDTSVRFDGSAETDGKFNFFAGDTGSVDFIGGAGNDTFHGGGSGATLMGGGGNDQFIFGGNFDGTSDIDGGSGFNLVSLDGNYSDGLTFGASSLQNIQELRLMHGNGNSYDLTLNAANTVAGQTFRLDASNLHNTDFVHFDGSAAAGNLSLRGGNGDDLLVGGQGHTVFQGALGADTLVAGDKSNHFVYTSVTDSNGTRYDTIRGFDATRDGITVINPVTGVDAAVTTGSLSDATFVTDLKHDIGAAQLGADHAVLFTADSGDEAGNTFLIIDQNGVAGYQFDGDIVIQLTGSSHLGLLSTADFLTHS
ncbi:MAG TPA: bluetail domain-containing putative surface protein [Rhizomicrobium sp.]|nr:bluetail domain-containing putative surface protein [Rhizomicrobium sp.]